MRDPSEPLLNRGPEALFAVLEDDGGRADRNLRSLTRSELLALASAGDRLAGMARTLVAETWPTFRVPAGEERRADA